MASFPDYYDILHVSNDASTEDIRQAYRKESLKFVYITIKSWTQNPTCSSPRTHPDRLFNASTEEKRAATERFQVSCPICELLRSISDIQVDPYRLSRTPIMCSLTHSAGASTISYPRADRHQSAPTTQTRRETFLTRLLVCSAAPVAAQRTDKRRVPLRPRNQA
jgi:DnaJ domain